MYFKVGGGGLGGTQFSSAGTSCMWFLSLLFVVYHIQRILTRNKLRRESEELCTNNILILCNFVQYGTMIGSCTIVGAGSRPRIKRAMDKNNGYIILGCFLDNTEHRCL